MYEKYILSILLFVMFIPFMVNAETCDTNKITIENITIENKTDNVKELNEATASGKNINLTLSMSEVGDNIEYKLVVRNDSNEDYELDENSFNLNSDYIDYSFETEDNSNVLKAKSAKIVYLKAEYKNEVPEAQFESGTFNDNKSMTINLSTEDIIKNPYTRGVRLLFLLLGLTISIFVISYALFRKKKYAIFMILISTAMIIIPISVYAICKAEITIHSNIQIEKFGNYVVNKNHMKIGEKLSDDIKVRFLPSQSIEDWKSIATDGLTKPFYLKHIFDSNKVIKESFVEFIISEEMANDNEGLIAGTYAIKGGDNGLSYEENVNLIKRVFDYDNHPFRCEFMDSFFGCYIDNLSVLTSPSGHAGVGDGLNYVYHCTIYYDGWSFCSNETRNF